LIDAEGVAANIPLPTIAPSKRILPAAAGRRAGASAPVANGDSGMTRAFISIPHELMI
jgi:hypothetical protein